MFVLLIDKTLINNPFYQNSKLKQFIIEHSDTITIEVQRNMR